MDENREWEQIEPELPPPEDEPDRQYYFIAKCRQWVRERSRELGRPLRAATVTFGCPTV